ncbi:hypothetical protein, variant 2 [Aphanomyces astaci]|uniref:Polycystin cation channel PKD1/PKD2 domain-containing protein n=1 Tax=Aphanomyces astaci TaxID=112090 RepID=W4HA90_APHAT|nr:hypothetical protein, variant 2 [Aphanomyces astaci]ETV88852.1 hypothetical protein, variant 2 [Aphanomyces astaci]|eukprot:XP_009821252.1 hypothetical protein, variant 2 [Aphanomyces astaci]
MQMSWIFRAVVHTLLVVGMTYHAVDVDSHLLPYSRNLYNELWRLLNGDDQDQPLNLFTIRRGVDHVHLVLANYFSLPDVALGKLHVAPFAGIPLPYLTVVFSSPSDPDHESSRTYILDKGNEQAWPEGLRPSASSSVTREFFDTLKHMTLAMEVQFKYNFSTQGQIQLHMAVTRQLPTPPSRLSTTARSPTDYIWRYVGLIVLSGGYLILETWAFLGNVVNDTPSWRVVLVQNLSGAFVVVTNVITIACFLHAWSEAPVLVYVEPLSWTYAVASMGQWLSLLRFLSFNPRTYILGLTLKRGAPQVVEFLIGVCPLFVGYVLFGTIMFGATVPRFAGMAATATTLFALANGDEIRDTFVSLPWHGQLYLYSYIVIFAYVVLMVCIGIMEDAFFTSAFPSLWKQSTATLTEDQWRHVVELIHDRTKASHPDMVACQTDILTHVERQLF